MRRRGVCSFCSGLDFLMASTEQLVADLTPLLQCRERTADCVVPPSSGFRAADSIEVLLDHGHQSPCSRTRT